MRGDPPGTADGLVGKPGAADGLVGKPGAADGLVGKPGTADGLVGSTPILIQPIKEWYTRGYLPHRDRPGLLQMITYHLADSLPKNAVEQLAAELSSTPPENQQTQKRKHIEKWLDSGHGSCVLRNPDAAACVVENWQHYAGIHYDPIAWVVMPNHVHVLIRVYEGMSLGTIVKAWKSYTSRRINSFAASQKPTTPQRSEKTTRQLWHREYWDRYIRDEKHFFAAVEYIHQNPVKAGLVSQAEQWPWSSATLWKDV